MRSVSDSTDTDAPPEAPEAANSVSGSRSIHLCVTPYSLTRMAIVSAKATHAEVCFWFHGISQSGIGSRFSSGTSNCVAISQAMRTRRATFSGELFAGRSNFSMMSFVVAAKLTLALMSASSP